MIVLMTRPGGRRIAQRGASRHGTAPPTMRDMVPALPPDDEMPVQPIHRMAPTAQALQRHGVDKPRRLYGFEP